MTGRAKKPRNDRGKRRTTAQATMYNSATITCTLVKDPNEPDLYRRFVVLAFPAKRIDSEILGPFKDAQESIGAALDYLRPLYDDKTENVYVRGAGGATFRYPVIDGKLYVEGIEKTN